AYRVANRGRARARAATVGFALSADRREGRGDVQLRSRRKLAALAARRSARGSARLTVTDAARGGRGYLLVCADPLRRVRESNERNNCRAAAMPGPRPPPRGPP